MKSTSWLQSSLSTLLNASLTVAAITQVGPDNVLLGEAEDSQSASSHCRVYDDARVRYHLSALVETNSANRQSAASNIALTKC